LTTYKFGLVTRTSKGKQSKRKEMSKGLLHAI